jgi:hypothetical protein
MQDIILHGYYEEFCAKHRLDTEGTHDFSKNFEQFANYVVMSRISGTDIQFPDVSTGDAPGIDGLAIIYNDQLIQNAEMLDAMNPASIQVKFILLR